MGSVFPPSTLDAGTRNGVSAIPDAEIAQTISLTFGTKAAHADSDRALHAGTVGTFEYQSPAPDSGRKCGVRRKSET